MNQQVGAILVVLCQVPRAGATKHGILKWSRRKCLPKDNIPPENEAALRMRIAEWKKI